jgi:hypothetical protein
MQKPNASGSPPRPLTVFVEGVGLLGPGLPGWSKGHAMLEGSALYESLRSILPLPMALPAAERRRAGQVVKVSLAVAGEAVAASGLAAETLPSVFTSSSGDAINCHEICSALASSDRLISPTRFHNSVHNAPSGYWSISSGSMASSSVLCARDGSFSAGLVEAMTQAVVEQTAVLLVAYDTDYPEPLYSVRPLPDTFGVGLVLAPQCSERSLAQWTLEQPGCFTESAATRMVNPQLERLRSSIPAARCLPLIQSIGGQHKSTIVLDYLAGLQLAVGVAPCR